MLTARRVAAAMAGIGVTVIALMTLLLAGPAGADGPGANCPPGVLDCDVTSGGGATPTTGSGGDGGGGGGGGASGSGSSHECIAHDTNVPPNTFEVPCYRQDVGWFNQSDACYWLKLDPQPAADDPAWNGHKPGDGALYNVVCPGIGRELQGGTTWLQNPPPGYGGGPNLAALAQDAITKMRLLGADIGIAPMPGSKGGSVGLPVWVWNRESPRTTGPTSASATALGVTVTATATLQKVVWNFGNGTTTSCAFPGRAYAASYGTQVPDKSQGECGFAGYGSTGDYTVTATTTWGVHWVGAGQHGDLTTTRASQVQIHIGEVQVVGQ